MNKGMVALKLAVIATTLHSCSHEDSTRGDFIREYGEDIIKKCPDISIKFLNNRKFNLFHDVDHGWYITFGDGNGATLSAVGPKIRKRIKELRKREDKISGWIFDGSCLGYRDDLFFPSIGQK
ncbi:hypothetical protein [Sphingobium aquiterrae]|uniref:hypothetical protein n=1 Tax=Sphingobium aquiterrae TaxID=2038656 RepID=UPI003015CFF2